MVVEQELECVRAIERYGEQLGVEDVVSIADRSALSPRPGERY